MKREKLLHQLYIRGRHNALSVITATQVWKALAPECRKQATALYIFKLRNYADLEGLAEELGAVHPDGKKGVLALYRRLLGTRNPLQRLPRPPGLACVGLARSAPFSDRRKRVQVE